MPKGSVAFKMIKPTFKLLAASLVLFALACGAASPPAPAATPTGTLVPDRAEPTKTAVQAATNEAAPPAPSPTKAPTPTPTDTSVPAPVRVTETLLPTATLEPGPPETSSVTVWPSLTKVEPSTASPGQEVRIEGHGGHTELRKADGTVAGYIESARSFPLYFDGQPVGSIGCYVNTCRGTVTVPKDALPGEHQISVEGGSSQTVTIAKATVTALPATPEPAPAAGQFTLRSDAFTDGGKIPTLYTCDGENVSPALSWGAPPAGAESLVIMMDDPDAPVGVWDHWVLFNLPASVSELPQGQAGTGPPVTGGVQGVNSWGESAYGGPCPPKGPAHNYRFFLYAIDTTLDLQPDATKSQVLNALEGHVLAESTLIGTYKRADEQPARPTGYEY